MPVHPFEETVLATMQKLPKLSLEPLHRNGKSDA
jgi:hypothetical protein